MSYMYNEPDEKTIYVDQTGKSHEDRDSAIKANIRDDLWDFLYNSPHFLEGSEYFVDILEYLIKQKPELLKAFADSLE